MHTLSKPSGSNGGNFQQGFACPGHSGSALYSQFCLHWKAVLMICGRIWPHLSSLPRIHRETGKDQSPEDSEGRNNRYTWQLPGGREACAKVLSYELCVGSTPGWHKFRYVEGSGKERVGQMVKGLYWPPTTYWTLSHIIISAIFKTILTGRY